MQYTEDSVNERSWRNREYAQIAVAKAMAYLLDKEKKLRLERKECSWCFYFNSGRMAGQAFTRWHCNVCAKEDMHPNTATPHVCNGCADKHKLCIECGADIHLRTSRRGSEKI